MRLFDNRLWKSILFDLVFLAVSVLLAKIARDSGQLPVAVLLFFWQLAAYSYLKWRVLKLYCEPKCGALAIGLSTLGIALALFLGGTLLLWAVQASVQESYQRMFSAAIILVLGVIGYVLLQGTHAALAKGVAWQSGFQLGKHLFLLLLVEGLVIILWYGAYRLFVFLLPWPSLNVLFQILSAGLLLIINAVNRASLFVDMRKKK
ncbi:hypothetical protein J4419_01255 [Candidatus Woesearchaeota archaeon]|nr:hypothetical protein [Candidatus Woesearchaeota archaeon]